MNILVVVHNYIGIGKIFGGVELTVKEVLEAASADSANPNRYFVLSFDHRRKSASDSGYVLLDMSQRSDNGTVGREVESFTVPYPVSLERYQDEEFSRKFRDLIQRYQIDIAHFFHLMYFPLNAPIVAQQAGALTILSLFDYYALCPDFHLQTHDKKFCGFPNGVTLDTCNACLKETFGYGYETQNLRRQLLAEIFSLTDAVQYLCEDERTRFVAAYPVLKEKETLVIGCPLLPNMPASNGVTPLPVVQSTSNLVQGNDSPSPSSEPTLPLRVVCLGNVSGEKGGDALLELFHRSALNSSKNKFQYHVYGDVRPPYDKKLEAFTKSESVVVHGRYDSQILYEELNGLHGVALFGSNWPETWVRTVSETVTCGLVPIAPRIGAFIERIADGVNGILYEPSSVSSMLEALETLADNPAKFASMRQELPSILCPTVEDNVRAFHDLYAKVYAASTQPEYARRRANQLARFFSTSRPVAWNMEVQAGEALTMPALPQPGTSFVRKNIFRRTWGVFRSRGLVYTIWATFNYQKLRRPQ